MLGPDASSKFSEARADVADVSVGKVGKVFGRIFKERFHEARPELSSAEDDAEVGADLADCYSIDITIQWSQITHARARVTPAVWPSLLCATTLFLLAQSWLLLVADRATLERESNRGS